ncbi:hypothetical protein ACFUTV_40095 [Streptomyces sp. NPDC057298]
MIRTVIAALSTLSFGLAVMNTYWAYYLLADLHVPPTAFGMIMGVGGAGSLAGALLASRIGIEPTIIIGFAVSPLAQIPLTGTIWRTAPTVRVPRTPRKRTRAPAAAAARGRAPAVTVVLAACMRP